ncbi:hypothetical protein TYRP_017278 [Tyrophagus putrescentiae]|nr:hypothetical protein TYRP_017278 [Tyrophagus putrescentiae]
MSISNWHLFESVWRPSLVVVNNGSSGSNDDDDDHGDCCRKSLARQANAVMRSSEALLSFTGSLAWVFWLDLAFRFISNLILAMMKSIWLSLASFLILKSIHFVVQRDFIIAKGLARNGMNFTCQFQAHVVNATDGNGNGNGNGGGGGGGGGNAAQSEVAASRTASAASTASANSGASTSASGSAASASASSSSCSTTRSSLRSSNGVHSQLSSAEVLRTLSSMQLENLRRFYRIFRVPAVVWVTACLVKLTALLEYLYVGGESFAPWSKESISFGDGTTLSSTLATFLFRWYECVFFGLSLAVTAADIILPVTVLICTSHYSRVFEHFQQLTLLPQTAPAPAPAQTLTT